MFVHHPPLRPLIFSGIFLFCLIFISTAAHSKIKTIRYHPGGSIIKVFHEVNRSVKSGVKVRITGRCMSACTLYLISKNVCLSKTATFKFHQAQFGYGSRFRARPDPKGTRTLMATYPPKLRNWIRRQGGLPWRGWLTLNARTAVRNGIAKYC